MIRRIGDIEDLEEEVGADAELSSALASLDPASRDPNYWLRFRWWVMSAAGPELARRRREGLLTIGEVVESWARALVPTAALVAALAGLLLLRSEAAVDWPPIGVEEVLLSEVEGNTIPIDVASLTFAAEIF
jgi:hypothetical protein